MREFLSVGQNASSLKTKSWQDIANGIKNAILLKNWI
jgi:hypothetical protein